MDGGKRWPRRARRCQEEIRWNFYRWPTSYKPRISATEDSEIPNEPKFVKQNDKNTSTVRRSPVIYLYFFSLPSNFPLLVILNRIGYAKDSRTEKKKRGAALECKQTGFTSSLHKVILDEGRGRARAPSSLTQPSASFSGRTPPLNNKSDDLPTLSIGLAPRRQPISDSAVKRCR